MAHEAPGPQGPTSAGGVLRAALLGLSGGLLLGGLFLLVLGLKVRISPPDCASLSVLDCGIEREIATDMGRLQSVSGAALLALGVAIIMLLRSRPPPSAASGPPSTPPPSASEGPPAGPRPPGG